MTADHFEVQRQHLLDEIRAEANFVAPVTGKSDFDDRVIGAMANVPLAIGHGKTSSQPFIVAIMTDLLDLRPDDVVLEVGTGLGYQAAILAELAGKVYSVELIDELAAQAKQRLKRQGYANLHLKVANGYPGWAE